MKAILLITLLIVSVSLFTSCNSDSQLLSQNEELLMVQNNSPEAEFQLKNADVQFCEPVMIPLQHKQNLEVGLLTISNTNTKLTIHIAGNNQFIIEKVQLWVGNSLSAAPLNKNMQPLPGRFPFKSSGENDYTFVIDQEQIAPNYVIQNGAKIFILAHIEAIDMQTGEKKSAWSDGQLLNTKSEPTYSEFYLCTPTGGGGCFPHVAFCGTNINGTFYLENNTNEKEITADNQELAGYVRYEEGKIIFTLLQDWSFYGENPVESISGYSTPGGTSTELDLGPLVPDFDRFYVNVPGYSYYVVRLNIQYCTTGSASE
ncbi:MAG: hypothetical protein ACK5M7_07465 [Draconibacterium sp.]